MPEKIKVVVVESHPILRKNFCLLLEFETDIEIVGETGNLEEALKLSLEGHPGVFIVDLTTLSIRGDEILETISDTLKDTRILAITQYDDEDYINKLFKAGASGLILKDTTIASLVKAVRIVGRGNIYTSPEILASWQNSCKPSTVQLPVSPRILKTRKSHLAGFNNF